MQQSLQTARKLMSIYTAHTTPGMLSSMDNIHQKNTQYFLTLIELFLNGIQFTEGASKSTAPGLTWQSMVELEWKDDCQQAVILAMFAALKKWLYSVPHMYLLLSTKTVFMQYFPYLNHRWEELALITLQTQTYNLQTQTRTDAKCL